MATKRTIIIEPGVDAEGGYVLRLDDAIARVVRLLGACAEIGGVIRIVTDRVKVGELPPDAGGRAEPIGETVGFLIEYEDRGPLHVESYTRRLMDMVVGGEEGAFEEASVATAAANREPAPLSLAAELEPDIEPEPERADDAFEEAVLADERPAEPEED